MRLTILTTITNPDQREDKWREAIACYLDLADEVVVVNGGIPLSVGFLFKNPRMKVVDLEWPEEWNWVEFARHLNAGLKECTGDWVLRLDIDQFVHEDDFLALRQALEKAPIKCDSATFQKMSMTYYSKYYQKGQQEIAFRRLPGVCFGEKINEETDLCYLIKQNGVKNVYNEDGSLLYELPRGHGLMNKLKTGINYWNYDYYFKTQPTTRKLFASMSRAYHRFFNSWIFGETEEESFNLFIEMLKGRYIKAPYTAKILSIHPKYIQQSIIELKPEQFGYNGWGLV